ncbi:MAG: sensor signal transduction histidine kinase [Crocinitomicaceae bacterium]|jgi:signal transduction histidine kinase|nr:sensor signal transduction histidine kinase [Crocinitomicaceae bacterium]
MKKNTPNSELQTEGLTDAVLALDIQKFVPVLTEAQKRSIIDYYELNKRYVKEYQEEALLEFRDHPVWGPIIGQMSPEMMEAQSKYSEVLQEAAIYHNSWEPYLKNMAEQGIVYAKMGVNFKDWLEVVLLARKYIVRMIEKEFENDIRQALSCMQGMNYLLDIALAVIGESYVVEEKNKSRKDLQETNESLERVVEERTEKLAESLDREKKLSDLKSTFVSMASHEFRTPLSTILSSVNLAEKYVANGEPEKSEKHFTRIKTMVQNLTEILQNFLSIDLLEQGEVSTEKALFNLRFFLADMLEGMESLKKDGQQILSRFRGEDVVFIDKKILRNILINLLSNAIKYSEKDIKLDVKVDNDYISIKIQDFGIGIPEDQHHQLFGKFFRADNAQTVTGTGLGLHIVKHYLELLEGSIDFESKEGQGTTFFLKLPAHPKKQIEKPSQLSEKAALSKK